MELCELGTVSFGIHLSEVKLEMHDHIRHNIPKDFMISSNMLT